MPLSDPNGWQEISKWLAGIAATFATLYAGAVRWWVGDRFKKVDQRIDSVQADVDGNSEKLSEHDSKIAAFEVHIENGSEQRKRIEDKIDHLTDLYVANRNQP